ncbi:hypothetical protein CEXT_448211 [Caerostris extrusa]|uniref:Secreted protein n=1 Tax=Caerostris extrusa TaxID=172846 RepID=A0AAV4QUY2_CAEEX|nr:hypothetical protein CEXT_448211 [Caerostris extrusa]
MQPVWPAVWRVCYHWTDDWLLQSPHFCAAFTAIKFRQSLSVWVIGLCHFFLHHPQPQGCTSGPVKNGVTEKRFEALLLFFFFFLSLYPLPFPDHPISEKIYVTNTSLAPIRQKIMPKKLMV